MRVPFAALALLLSAVAAHAQAVPQAQPLPDADQAQQGEAVRELPSPAAMSRALRTLRDHDAALRGLLGGTAALPLAAVPDRAGQQFDVRRYGARGDGTTGDSAAFGRAAAACEAAGGGTVFAPSAGAAYVLEAGITLPSGCVLRGDGGRTFHGSDSLPTTWTKAGSWVRCADRKDACITVAGVGSGVRDLSIVHDQPAMPANAVGPNGRPRAGGAWTPVTYPYAIRVTQSFFALDNLLLVGASHGIVLDYRPPHGGGTYSWLGNLFLSTWQVGIRFANVNDTVRAANIHHRAMWLPLNLAGQAYTEANLVAWDVQYLDNVMVSGLECLQARTCIRFTDGEVPFSTALNVRHACGYCVFEDVQFNLVAQAVAVADGTTTVQAVFSNVVAQTDFTTGAAAPFLFDFGSSNAHVMMSNVWTSFAGRGFMRLGAGPADGRPGGGRASIANLWIDSYSGNGAGSPAFDLRQGAVLDVPTGVQNVRPAPQPYGGGSAGPKVIGAGSVASVEPARVGR